MQQLTEQKDRLKKVYERINNPSGLFWRNKENDISEGEILTVHNAYVSLFESGQIENYLGETLQAIQIANSIAADSMNWKVVSKTVMDAVKYLADNGEIHPAVIYEEAAVLQNEAEAKQTEELQEDVSNVVERFGIINTGVSTVVEPIASTYKKYILTVGAIVLVGGGLYGYTLYTVNKKL